MLVPTLRLLLLHISFIQRQNGSSSNRLTELHKLVQEDRPSITLLDCRHVLHIHCELVHHLPQIQMHLVRLLAEISQVGDEPRVERHDGLQVHLPELLSDIEV